jgi:hypothetical protein
MRRREEKQQEEASEVSDLENRASSRTNKKKKKQIGPPKPKRITARIVSVESSSSYMVVSDEENDHLLTPSSEEPAAVVAAEVRWAGSPFLDDEDKTCSEISSGRVWTLFLYTGHNETNENLLSEGNKRKLVEDTQTIFAHSTKKGGVLMRVFRFLLILHGISPW